MESVAVRPSGLEVDFSWAPNVLIPALTLAALIFAILLYSEKLKRRARARHIMAIKHSLQLVRQHCTETLALREILGDDVDRTFARDMGWSLLNIENHVSALLDDQEFADASAAMKRWLARDMPVQKQYVPNPEMEDPFEPPDLDRLCKQPGRCQDRADVYWWEKAGEGRTLMHKRRKGGLPSLPCSGKFSREEEDPDNQEKG